MRPKFPPPGNSIPSLKHAKQVNFNLPLCGSQPTYTDGQQCFDCLRGRGLESPGGRVSSITSPLPPSSPFSWAKESGTERWSMLFAVISVAWLLLGGVLSPGTINAWPAAGGHKRRSAAAGHDYSSSEPTGGDDYQDSSAGNDYSAGRFKKKKTAGHDYSSSEPTGGDDYQDSSAGNDYSAGSFKKKTAGHDYSSTELSGGDDYHHPAGNDYSAVKTRKKKKTAAGHDYSSSEFAVGGADYQDQSSGEDYAVSGGQFAGEDYAADEGEDYADEDEGEDYADEDEGGADYSGDADPPPFIGRVHEIARHEI
jgi:hypothetical protein